MESGPSGFLDQILELNLGQEAKMLQFYPEHELSLIRLNRIDLSVPRSVTKDTAGISEFRAHFGRLANNQWLEIAHFKQRMLEESNYLSEDLSEQLEAITEPATNLNLLEERERFLDELNVYLINKCIDFDSIALVLKGIGLTRFPSQIFIDKTLEDYWATLKRLDCQYNLLRCLPEEIAVCKSLKQLDCNNNELQFLPNALENFLLLEVLSCFENAMQTLPELGKCPKLQSLYCYGNPFKSFPESIKSKFGVEWCAAMLDTESLTLK